MNNKPNFSPEKIAFLRRVQVGNKRKAVCLYTFSLLFLIKTVCLLNQDAQKLAAVYGITGFLDCAVADMYRRQNCKIRNILDIINDKSR